MEGVATALRMLFLWWGTLAVLPASFSPDFSLSSDDLFPKPEHHLLPELLRELSHSFHNFSHCEKRSDYVTGLIARVANDYSILNLHGDIHTVLVSALDKMDPDCTTHSRIAYFMSVMAFSRGAVAEAEKYHAMLNPADLVFQRAHAAQVMIAKDEAQGMALLLQFTSEIGRRMGTLLFGSGGGVGSGAAGAGGGAGAGPGGAKKKRRGGAGGHTGVGLGSDGSDRAGDSDNGAGGPPGPAVVRALSTNATDDILLDLLLSEAQGLLRKTR